MSRKAHKTLSAAGQKEALAPIDQPEPLQRDADNVDALSDSEGRFRAVFENAAVGIARVGPDGRWLEVNQRLCDIVGYSREELMTKTFADITHPDDLDQDAKAVRRMLAGEIDTCAMEKRYFRKGGSVVWVNLTFSMTRKTDGSPDYFISFIEDISARRKAEEKLSDSEERLRLASSAAGLGVFEWKVEPDYAVWENDRMYEIFGLSRADGTLNKMQVVERYMHPDDVTAFEQALKNGMKSGRPFHVVFRIRRKDGALRWVELAGNFELAPDETPTRMIGVLTDTTERRRAEGARLKRVALCADVVSALAEHGQPLQNMLQKTAEAMVRHLDAAFARIWTLNPEKSMLELQASAGMYTRLNGEYSRICVGEFKIGLIASERKPHLTNDVLNDPRISDPEWARENGMTAFAGYPLQVEDRIVGVMGMFSRHPLTEDTIDAIASIAAPIAQAIERKRAEDARRASEEQFRILADTAPVMVWVADTNKLCTFFNKPWLDFTGRAMEEELGAGWTEGIHPADYERCMEVYARSFEAREPFEMEYRLRRHDGEYRWILDHGVPRFSPGGDFLGYIGSCLDINERKEVEEALRESESRFRKLTESLPQLVWTCLPDGACDYVSPQWIEYTGGPEAEERGFGWLRRLHPDERESVYATWLQAASQDRPFDVEFRLRRNDGEYRWFMTRAVALKDSCGQIIKWFGSSTDIDDQKRAEASQRESRDRLAGIVSSAMDAIITVDENQLIVLFNAAAEGMFGCAASEALGQPLERFIPERFRRSHTEDVRRFGETGGTSRAMGRLGVLAALRVDGSEFPIEASISAIEVGGRKLYTVIHRDITERKRAEVEREQLAREQVARATAEAANRSKDEFLALVSHELRSPLNAILGYARMLRAYSLGKAAADNAAAAVERSAKAQLQIIEDLLDSARIVTGKLRIEPGLVDLASALEAALDTVRPAAEAKGVTLAADFGPAPVEVLGDSMRLQQVVWNLLANAVKFTPEGGRVELRMEGGDDDVRIIVSDTGKGIEPEFLPFVFDRFRQADTSGSRRHGGLGLGLSLAKHLVELHGGAITAASDGAGRGATFTVTLPRRHPAFVAPPAVAPSAGAVAPRADLSLEGVNVLAVDDQEEARVILSQTLIEYGARVTAVSSGAEALALLSDPPGGKRPDVLILDIAMPEEDGFTVLKKARELEAAQGAGTRIPAVALTAFGRSEDRLRALQAGFQTHIVKPVEPAELALVIASLTGRNVGPP
jgi:PAS domain S-box-containing protein